MAKGRRGYGRRPIIRAQALTDYVKRPRDSFDFMKLVPMDELKKNAYDLGMRFATDVWHNQLVCWTIAEQMRYFYFLLKQGGGKSKIGLDAVRYRKRKGHLSHALVTVPELIHVASWEDQIRQHAPDLTYNLLIGDKGERERMVRRPADVTVCNHRGLDVMMSRFRTKADGDKLGGRILDPKAASEFAATFNMFLVDEIHRMVNLESLLYQEHQWLRAAADFFYGFTGTPHGRDPMPLFGQFQLIDQGETLGRIQEMFQQAFFVGKKDWFKGINYVFNPKMVDALHRIIKHRSITYETEELHDLPRCVPIRHYVKPRGDMLQHYKRILKGVHEAQGDYSTLKNLFVRMRQCASGFLALRADDETRIEVEFKDNPKMDDLHAFMTSRPNEKIMIYHEFIHSGVMIERMLKQAGIPCASLRGGTRSPAEEYRRFLNDSKCKAFVLNHRTGSESINPQYVCRREVFYESPPDAKMREQAERRVYRQGQKHISFIHDLIVQGTIEKKVWEYGRDGKDIMRAVMSGDVTLLEAEDE